MVPWWIAILVGLFIGLPLGACALFYWVKREDHGANGELLEVFIRRQQGINATIIDFENEQLETNKLVMHKLDILERDLRFCPKVSDSFFQKKEGDQ